MDSDQVSDPDEIKNIAIVCKAKLSREITGLLANQSIAKAMVDTMSANLYERIFMLSMFIPHVQVIRIIINYVLGPTFLTEHSLADLQNELRSTSQLTIQCDDNVNITPVRWCGDQGMITISPLGKSICLEYLKIEKSFDPSHTYSYTHHVPGPCVAITNAFNIVKWGKHSHRKLGITFTNPDTLSRVFAQTPCLVINGVLWMGTDVREFMRKFKGWDAIENVSVDETFKNSTIKLVHVTE